MMTAQIIFSVVFFLALYKLIPLKLTFYLGHWIPAINATGFRGQILFNLVDGMIRLANLRRFPLFCSRARKTSGASSNTTAPSTKSSSTSNPASL
jgi:hypothetical protein